MCVAVVVPAGKRLSEDVLKAMHAANRDSWGFAFYEPYRTRPASGPEGFVSVNRDITNTEDMLKRYEIQLGVGKRAEYPHLIHFRIRTSGLTNVANAHPFVIKNGALVHNGHFAGHNGGNFSDTYYWSKMFGDTFSPELTEEQKKYLGGLIGRYNKVAMLFNNGTTAIINEQEGDYLDDGTWVSNSFWQHRITNNRRHPNSYDDDDYRNYMM